MVKNDIQSYQSNIIIIQCVCNSVISGLFLLAASSTVSSSTTEQPTSSSSSTNIKVMPTSTKETSTVKVVTPSKDIIPLPTAPLPPQITAGALSGAGLLSPMQSVLLLLLFITCILIL